MHNPPASAARQGSSPGQAALGSPIPMRFGGAYGFGGGRQRKARPQRDRQPDRLSGGQRRQLLRIFSRRPQIAVTEPECQVWCWKQGVRRHSGYFPSSRLLPTKRYPSGSPKGAVLQPFSDQRAPKKPSRRSSKGMVRPWATIEKATTAKVRTTISSRRGSPAGRDRASARPARRAARPTTAHVARAA